MILSPGRAKRPGSCSSRSSVCRWCGSPRPPRSSRSGPFFVGRTTPPSSRRRGPRRADALRTFVSTNPSVAHSPSAVGPRRYGLRARPTPGPVAIRVAGTDVEPANAGRESTFQVEAPLPDGVTEIEVAVRHATSGALRQIVLPVVTARRDRGAPAPRRLFQRHRAVQAVGVRQQMAAREPVGLRLRRVGLKALHQGVEHIDRLGYCCSASRIRPRRIRASGWSGSARSASSTRALAS